MVAMMYDLRGKGFYDDILDFVLELLFVWINENILGTRESPTLESLF
jgi:hypothetical protein